MHVLHAPLSPTRIRFEGQFLTHVSPPGHAATLMGLGSSVEPESGRFTIQAARVQFQNHHALSAWGRTLLSATLEDDVSLADRSVGTRPVGSRTSTSC